jgi:rubrerythrin
VTENAKKKIAEIRHMIEVAQLAIPKERESRDHYLNASRKAPGETARLLFERLAAEEQGHEDRLKAIIRHLQEQLNELQA